MKGMRKDGGNALVEFAMTLPVLAMLLVGILYGGITFYDYVTLANAVSIGARTLAVSRSAGTGGASGQNACVLAQAAVESAATNLKASFLSIPTPTFAGASTCSALASGDSGTVAASYPCQFTVPFANVSLCPGQGAAQCGAASPCIRAATTVRIE